MKITIHLYPEVAADLKRFVRQVRNHRRRSRVPRWLSPSITDAQAAGRLVELGVRWVNEHGIEAAEQQPMPRGFVPLIVAKSRHLK